MSLDSNWPMPLGRFRLTQFILPFTIVAFREPNLCDSGTVKCVLQIPAQSTLELQCSHCHRSAQHPGDVRGRLVGEVVALTLVAVRTGVVVAVECNMPRGVDKVKGTLEWRPGHHPLAIASNEERGSLLFIAEACELERAMHERPRLDRKSV